MRPQIIRKTILKLLKSSKKQFHDQQGKPISTDEYVELLFKQKLSDAKDYQKKLQKEKEKQKNDTSKHTE